MQIFAANWKMNFGGDDGLAFFEELKTKLKIKLNQQIIICPPATILRELGQSLDLPNLYLGAQNIFYQDQGPFTGEIAAAFIKEANCRYVIIGHSERRQLLMETDDMINQKIKAALKHQLKPILCVGETLAQREDNQQRLVIEAQLQEALQGIPKELLTDLIIAYEPVWAIGTGLSATATQVRSIVKVIKEALLALGEVKILYGGSVNGDNIKEFMAIPELSGALVGGASLKAASFESIINWEEE